MVSHPRPLKRFVFTRLDIRLRCFPFLLFFHLVNLARFREGTPRCPSSFPRCYFGINANQYVNLHKGRTDRPLLSPLSLFSDWETIAELTMSHISLPPSWIIVPTRLSGRITNRLFYVYRHDGAPLSIFAPTWCGLTHSLPRLFPLLGPYSRLLPGRFNILLQALVVFPWCFPPFRGAAASSPPRPCSYHPSCLFPWGSRGGHLNSPLASTPFPAEAAPGAGGFKGIRFLPQPRFRQPLFPRLFFQNGLPCRCHELGGLLRVLVFGEVGLRCEVSHCLQIFFRQQPRRFTPRSYLR